MIAKLIVWDESRAAAARQLRAALSRVEVLGLKTNAELLARVSAHPAFLEGDVHTGFLAEHVAKLLEPDARASEMLRVLACLGLLETRKRAVEAARRGAMLSPWDALDGFRVNEGRVESICLRTPEQSFELELRHEARGIQLRLADTECSLSDVSLSGTALACMCNGERLQGRYAEREGQVHVSLAGRSETFEHPWVTRAGARAAEVGESVIKAPMPGKIIGILVSLHERVQVGTPLLRLEAMKMEHTLKASLDGVVSELSLQLGGQVEAGSTLLVLKASEEGGT